METIDATTPPHSPVTEATTAPEDTAPTMAPTAINPREALAVWLLVVWLGEGLGLHLLLPYGPGLISPAGPMFLMIGGLATLAAGAFLGHGLWGLWRDALAGMRAPGETPNTMGWMMLLLQSAMVAGAELGVYYWLYGGRGG